MGKRSAAVGFVSEVANTLLQAADASNQELHCAALAAVLESSDDWQGSIQQQGSIHSLLQVRCGTGQDRSIGCSAVGWEGVHVDEVASPAGRAENLQLAVWCRLRVVAVFSNLAS
jgi:hypothetical protein